MLIVQKYGGTSLGDGARVGDAARRVARLHQQGHEMVVVVSAQGDMTDLLIEKAAAVNRRGSAREMDAYLAAGEQMSAGLMAMAIGALGVPAVSLTGRQAGIITDGVHGNARILEVDTARIRRELGQGKAVVVAGFQGVDENQEITTIGRGGSDTTAVALASALKADVCRIYTDVKGVYSADPRVVDQALVHREISYDEMLEMAALGAQVLHCRAVELAREHSVKVEVRSTFEPDFCGTALGVETAHVHPVRGLACDEQVAMVTVLGLDSGRETCRLFTLLADSSVSIDVIIRSPGTAKNRGVVSFSISETERETVSAVLKSSQRELGFSGFLIQTGMAKVSAVGAGMSDGCGVAANMLRALQEGNIEPQYITTGELRISVILPRERAKEAVRLLHKEFFGY